MRWGFPPPPGVRNAVVNVRNYHSAFWRSALANPERRCLVPVTSFRAWSVEPDPIKAGAVLSSHPLMFKPLHSLYELDKVSALTDVQFDI